MRSRQKRERISEDAQRESVEDDADPAEAAAAKTGVREKKRVRRGQVPLAERFAVSSKTITPLCAGHVQLTIASRGIVHLSSIPRRDSSGPTPCPLNDDDDGSEGVDGIACENDRVTSRVASRQIMVRLTERKQL